MYSFIRNYWTVFPKWLGPVAFSPAMNGSSYCSTSSSPFGVVNVAGFDKYNRCVVVSHCYFINNLHFPCDIWYRAYFYTLCHLHIFFGEVLLAHFLIAWCSMFSFLLGWSDVCLSLFRLSAWLKQQTFIVSNSEDWKSKIKASSNVVLCWDLLQACRWLPSYVPITAFSLHGHSGRDFWYVLVSL